MGIALIKQVEGILERWLFTSRWLLLPLYVGLTVMFAALGVKFFQELLHIIPSLWSMHESALVLATLTLVDMVLVANLLVMVILSGYENHVSRLDLGEDQERLSWLGKLDSGSLKVKLAASIVAISSIHLLKAFVDVEKIANDKLLWMVVIHLTFVVSAVLMAAIDRLSSHD
ncbi:MAG: TIGR00645 family protein [Magnetococcus sp. WYHC-3]